MSTKKKADYELGYFSADRMSLNWLRDQVCFRDSAICRTCECLDACAIGRRYIREVDAGAIVEAPKAKPAGKRGAHLANLRRDGMERRVQLIKDGLAAGKSIMVLYREAGYAEVKNARRAVSRYNKKYGEAIVV